MSKKISAGALSFLNGYGSESEETQSMSEDETVEPSKERSDTVKDSPPETAESIVRGILDDLIKSLSVSSSSSLCSMNNMESSYIEDRKGGMDVSEDSSEADEEESKRLEERRKEWRVDDRRCSATSTSSSSSSSDSSSSDSSSSSSSDEDDSDGEEEEEGSKPKGPQNKKKSKAEFSIHDLPPIEDLHITVPEHECVELGQVSSIVDTLVVVQSMPGKPAVDLESVLFLDKGSRPLGKVFDVIGPVSLPLYCVRFNSHDHIKEAGVSVGTSVYVAPRTEHTAFIFFDQLLKMKGTDASWKDDQETPAQFADYSDDESEQKSRKKNKTATYKPGDEGGGGDGAPPARKQKRAYNPPRPGSQRSQQNIFYRQNRRFNPRDHGGGIRWDRPPPPPPVQAPHYGGGHPPAPGPSAPQMYSVPPPQPPHGPQGAGYSGPQTYQGASSSGYHHQYPPPPPPPIQHPPGQFHRPPPPPLHPQQQPSWGSGGGQSSGYPQRVPRPLPNPFSATSTYPPPPPPPPAPQPTFGSPYDGTKPPGT